MPRRRDTAVRESVTELADIARRLRGSGDAARVEMLLALRRDPAATFAEVASRVGYSERNVLRWWQIYRRRGLAGLLRQEDATAAPSGHGAAALFGAARDGVAPVASGDAQQELSARMARFLNAMPTTARGDEWMRRFHAALKALLVGVDMVTLRVNLAGDEEEGDDGGEPDPDVEAEELVIVDASERGGAGRRDGRRRGRGMRAQRVVTTPGRTLIAQMIAEGFPASGYQIPAVFDYFVDENRYVGTIVLWRDRSSTPVPAATLDLMRTIQPFLAFALSDCVNRSLRHDPEQHYVRHIVESIAARIGLRGRELEIFALQLAGADRREIAERQGIALSTVGKYIASIHAKAGTRNYAELLTRFAEREE